MMFRVNRNSRRRLLLALFVFGNVLLSVGAKDPNDGGGIGGTGITGVGPVQRFGSVFVNGREYFLTAQTRVMEEGNALTEHDLRLGDIVVVKGRANGRSEATAITVERALQGLAEKINSAEGTFTVLGQVVHVLPGTFDGTTANRPFDLSAMRVGDAVSMSGLARADGSWSATLVQRQAPVSAAASERFLLRGTLRDVNRKQGLLTVGARSLPIAPENIPSGLSVDKPVRIAGRYQNGVPMAETVRHEERLTGDAVSLVELAGHVQSLPAAGQMICNGVLFRYGKETIFAGGGVSDLRTDIPVVVRGTMQADGSVALERVILNAVFLLAELPPRQHGAAGGEQQRPESIHPQREPPAPARPVIDRPSMGRP